MSYREWAAPSGSALACLWEHRVGDHPHVQRVVPDGCMDLIWSPGLLELAGPDTAPFEVAMPPGTRMIGIRFRPGMAPPAIGLPADAVRDVHAPLRDFWGPTADHLTTAIEAAATLTSPDITAHPTPTASTPAEQLDTSPGATTRLTTTSDTPADRPGTSPELTARLMGNLDAADQLTTAPASVTDRPVDGHAATTGPGARPRLDRPVAGFSGGPGGVLYAAVLDRLRAPAIAPDPAVPALAALLARESVRQAADRLGFSERQLRRRAHAAFGYGPKTLQRILRFQRALDLAHRGIPYADVAARLGYTDQAHLSHDVRALAGVPLTTLTA